MARSKNHKENETLLGEIRKLKAENRNLKKRIRQLEKIEHAYENDLVADEPEDEKEPIVKCKECGKGELKFFKLLDRMYEECDICGHRKKVN